MSQFKNFAQKVREKFSQLQGGVLFHSSVDGNTLWDIYINSFKPQDNPIFRDPNSSSHNDNLDKSFIRRYGNVVAIIDGKIVSMWEHTLPQDDVYYQSSINMAKALAEAPIADIFLETYDELTSLPYEKANKTQQVYKLGFESNYKIYTQEEATKFGKVDAGTTYQFHHFNGDLKRDYVDFSGSSKASIQGNIRSSKEVFKRALDEIPVDVLYLVRDLINQGSLLDGATHLFKVEQMIPLKLEYDTVSNQDSWCWLKSNKLPFAKFKNELIGVLCSEIAGGMDLNLACTNWNKRVDPANYMKAVAPITKKQIDEAKKFVQENDYEASFDRRFATIDDIKVSEILHSNVGDGKIKPVSIFDSVKTSTAAPKINLDKVEEVTIDKFMNDILPSCTSIDVYLENKFDGNMVSLTTANNKESKPIFKWTNNYSWTYNGNLAGKSQIKEAVKVAGGKIDGVLRVSMIWNESGRDNSDLDIWCEQPDRQRIGFNAGFRKDSGNRLSSCSGQLDLDNTGPGTKVGVENIYFEKLSSMKNGTYKFWVNQYSARGSQGFKFEVEFEGQMFQYEYNKPATGNIAVAEVTLKDGVFTIDHKLPVSGSIKKEIYGLETNQFHKVNLVCLSPNHWGDNNIGNKHYFFMLDGCKTPSSIRSFHSENLIPELAAHRKVLEVLGTTTMIEPNNNQLSGLGFNATVKDDLIVRLGGTHKRVIKIKF